MFFSSGFTRDLVVKWLGIATVFIDQKQLRTFRAWDERIFILRISAVRIRISSPLN